MLNYDDNNDTKSVIITTLGRLKEEGVINVKQYYIYIEREEKKVGRKEVVIAMYAYV